jgi:glutamine synthetase
MINSLQYNHSTTLLVGFEIEVTFLSRKITTTVNMTELHHEPYILFTQSHSWNTLSPTQRLQLPFITAIVLGLDSMAIELQQIYSESAPGQYKFILSPLPPLLAIDTLIQARETISQIAASHGQRATLYPSPFAGADPGTAAHAHISLLPPNRATQFFVGGVLHHIQAICAFSLPEQASYTRDGIAWVAWGTQNPHVPLRRISDEKWEVRCLDGTANMYFALGAVIAAGLLGLQSATEGEQYAQADLQANPSMLDEAGRAQYGVLKEMPKSFADALVALMADGALVEALGHELVRDYVVVRESEQKKLNGMGEMERRVYLIERY